MAISKARKDELMSQYVELLKQSQAIFLAEYAGMSVQQLEALRSEVRKVGGALHVTKNTLLYHALEKTGKGTLSDEMLAGQLVTSFAFDDMAGLAKVLIDSAKKQDKLKLRGAIIDKSVIPSTQIEAIATLPTLPQLRSQIIGLINAPAQNLTSAMANGVRQLVNVLDAYANKSETAETVA